MTEIALLKLAHILGLVYWLGADLGVYYSSYVVCDEEQPPAVRVSAAKMLFALDLAPRVCMTLMLPLGIHLAALGGFLLAPEWLVPATWVLAAGWLATVLLIHFRGHGGKLAWLTRMDGLFRIVLGAGLLLLAGAVLTGAFPTVTDWAAWKLGIFGAMVLLGLMIRRQLRPFGAAFGRLVSGEAGPQENQAIRKAIRGSRPYVLAIWAGLLLSAALGVHLWQP